MRILLELEQEEDGRWLAEIPVRPGVMVYGSTPQHARKRVEALALRVLSEQCFTLMSETSSSLRPELTLKAALSPALGKIASGLYVVTAIVDGAPVGMLCSFVEQASFEPPMITLAIAPERPISPALVPGGHIGLHVLAKSNNALMKSFARGSTPESFTAHERVENSYGVPQFAEAWAFLVAMVQQEVAAGDHIIYLAEVVDGALQKEGEESMVRVRANGFNY